MKKIRILLALLLGIMLAACPAMGEETAAPTAEPAAAEQDDLTEIETQDIPDVINRVADPQTAEDFRFAEDARLLHIWFPNIMNADEAILMFDGEVWLIDCGDEDMGARGAALLRKLKVKQIEKLLVTHPHHDHLNGLQANDKAAKVKELLICYGNPLTKREKNHIKKAKTYAQKKRIETGTFGEGTVLTMGDGAVTLTCYANTDTSLDTNNRSAQIMIRYGDRTILFMGDMEQPGQTEMLRRAQPSELKADLLKYPHHGKSAMIDEFFQAVSPEAAIVTNKAVENWGGVRYLKKQGIPYIYTNQAKVYLHLVTDGANWIVEQVPQDAVPASAGSR